MSEENVKSAWEQLPGAIRLAIWHLIANSQTTALKLDATALEFTINDAVIRVERLTIRKGETS